MTTKPTHTMDTLILERSEYAQCWTSRAIDGKHRTEALDLFGTDTLPTAFGVKADGSTVLARIQAMNPDCRVIIGDAR